MLVLTGLYSGKPQLKDNKVIRNFGVSVKLHYRINRIDNNI